MLRWFLPAECDMYNLVNRSIYAHTIINMAFGVGLLSVFSCPATVSDFGCTKWWECFTTVWLTTGIENGSSSKYYTICKNRSLWAQNDLYGSWDTDAWIAGNMHICASLRLGWGRGLNQQLLNIPHTVRDEVLAAQKSSCHAPSV